MIREGVISIKTYGGLSVRADGLYSFSGSGGSPPKKPKDKPRPIKPPKKK